MVAVAGRSWLSRGQRRQRFWDCRLHKNGIIIFHVVGDFDAVGVDATDAFVDVDAIMVFTGDLLLGGLKLGGAVLRMHWNKLDIE